MLRLLAFALCLLLAVISPARALDACSADAQASYRSLKEAYSRGLLFRISKCGVTDSYIFGTYHSDNENMWSNAQSAVTHMTESTIAIFEITGIMDPAVIQSAMYFPEGSPNDLQTLLGDKDFNLLYARIQLTSPMPLEALRRMRPWAADLLVQTPKTGDDKNVLDDRLKAAATEKDIPLAALETLREQFGVFTQFTTGEQITMLRETLTSLPQLDELERQTVQAYLTQDLRRLGKLADTGFRMTRDDAIREKMIRNLVTARNENMVNRMIPYIDQGGAFVAVGALHLMGDGGILPELEKLGYYVTPM